MKTEDLKAQGLTDEQITFVMGENGKDLKVLQDENATLKTEKAQLENDKKVITKEKEDKEKAIADLQKNSISKDEYDKKIKEIEDSAKNEKTEYILSQLVDKALDDAKILKNENSRKAVKGLLDMEKVSIAKDEKTLVGLKEQLDELKKTDSYFFEKKASGYEPVNPEGDKGDGDGEVSMAANFAKEANKSESQETKSQFFN